MLKFIKGNLEQIESVEWYPMISLLIFFGFFVLLLGWVATAKKTYLNSASNVPFEEDNPKNTLSE